MNQVGLNSNKIVNFKSAQAMQLQNPQLQNGQMIPDVQIPQIYQVQEKNDGATFKEKLKKWDVMGLVYQWFEHPFMMLGTCAGLAWGVDKFSSACGGQYETSLVGKAARLGDDIQESKFVQSKPFQTVLDVGRGIKNKFNKIFKNSDVINAIKHTPSQPEWGFVKDELLTMEQRVVHDFSLVVNKLVRPEYGDGTQFIKLTDLGVDGDDLKFVEKFFKGVKPFEEQASNAIQLKRIGLADDAIREILANPAATDLVKVKQLEKLGVDEAFLDKLSKNPATKEDIAKVREACKKAKGMRVGEGHQKWLGKFQPFARKIGLDEVGNRLTSMSEAKTRTGRAFATFLQKCHRGFTFGGGKMGVLLFVSPLLVETMLDVKEAQANEKVGTAAHGGVHAVSWVFTFPLALSIMHRLAGVQYAGMSKEAVEECRTLIKEFNEKANPYKESGFFDKLLGRSEKKAAGEFFETIGEYNAAKDKLKARLKELHTVKDQNLITKICKKVGKFVTMDLETISSFKNGFGSVGNQFSRLGNTMKNVCGVPLRVGLWAALTMGVLDTLINKGIKGCFGNYYDRYKEEEFTEAKKTQKKFLKEDLKNRLYEAQQEKVMGVAAANNEFNPPEKIQATLEEEKLKAQMEAELKRRAKVAPSNEIQKEQPIAQQTPANDEVAVSTPVSAVPQDKPIAKPVEKDTNTYIPSIKPVDVKPAEPVKRDNYTYIPSSENVIKKDEKDADVNKYIPSQQGSNFTKTFDNSGLEAALRRADRAEQRAIQTLAGNFNSY